ncbi:MAG: RtcB family protein [Acidobacteriota bacterium]|nr:RtcB family protein [Acidobacteriota bacterium]MDH3524639.1 RtcB family protein [Acidobacteriota bacterium]
MKARDIRALGIPDGRSLELAIELARSAGRGRRAAGALRDRLRRVAAAPEAFVDDDELGPLAAALVARRTARASFEPRAVPAPFRQWGSDLEATSVRQMENACALPVSVRGALMPDAHQGYGLPIGGVLAVRNAVIPYAVGVDIACRVKMSVFDLPPATIDDDLNRLKTAIARETRFGIGAHFKDRRRRHDVMDADWSVTPVTAQLKDRAWSQLGTSGSGNHFVEFGVITVGDGELPLERGEYLALLSHSGSRGAGATIASHYSRLAMRRRAELPRELTHLAWLDLDSEEGQQYWSAMTLMGEYAAANHACIHAAIAEHLGAEVLYALENHHNFAWKEEHDGELLVVHRKGATPAGAGVLGIIPGSMATPTYVVRGRGNEASLRSSAHGAGRVMSRTRAKKELSWQKARELLARRRVTLMSAGLDEVPAVYKDIDAVMRAQADLVDPIAKFQPRLVKMAPPGERPED